MHIDYANKYGSYLSFTVICQCVVLQSALFSLYPPQDEDEVIEKRIPAEVPCEHVVHRILVKCIQLK